MSNAGTNKPEGRVARRKAEARARILRAGRDIFVERGIDAPSIAEIAAAADVSVGAFYLQFKDRDDLVDTLLTESVDEIRVRLLAELTAQPKGAALLPAAIRALLTVAYEERQLFALIIAERGRLAHGLKARRSLIEQLSLLLQAEAGASQVNGMDTDIVARFLTGIILQAGLWWQDHEEPGPAEMERQVVQFLTHGLPASLFDNDGPNSSS